MITAEACEATEAIKNGWPSNSATLLPSLPLLPR